MTERNHHASVILKPHQPLFEAFAQRVQQYPGVNRVEGRSYPEALIICLVVNSSDEAVWDGIADAEQDIARAHPDIDVVFRECDLNAQSLDQFAADLPAELADQLAAAS